MQLTRGDFLKATAAAAIAASPTTALAQLCEREAHETAPDRRIQDVEIYPFDIPLVEPFQVAIGTISVASNVLVRLCTADGTVGWGEAAPFAPVTGENQKTGLAVASELTASLRGHDPFEIAAIIAEMDNVSVYNSSMKAGIEMAVWDLCGKIAGQPLYRLLGAFRDSFETDITVSLNPPQVMAEKARAFAAQGYQTLKVKLGESPELDLERIRLIREAVGARTKIRVDANQGWSPIDTVRALRAMEKYHLQICEQPVPYWDLMGLKYVRQNSPIPIMADECVHSPHDAISVIREQAVDVINIKLMKAGGVLRGVQIANIAAAAGLTCMVGCMEETRIALTAAAHVVASQPNIVYADLDSFTDLAADPVIGGMKINQGVVSLPESPGLGVDIDPTFWSKLHRA